jgi:hypothetical protein
MRQFPFHQLARFVREPVKSHADSMPGITINNVAFDDDVLACQRNPQRQRFAHRNISLRAHVQAAHAYIFGAGHARCVTTIKMHIDNNSRTIVLPSFIAGNLFRSIFINHLRSLGSRRKQFRNDGLYLRQMITHSASHENKCHDIPSRRSFAPLLELTLKTCARYYPSLAIL